MSPRAGANAQSQHVWQPVPIRKHKRRAEYEYYLDACDGLLKSARGLGRVKRVSQGRRTWEPGPRCVSGHDRSHQRLGRAVYVRKVRNPEVENAESKGRPLSRKEPPYHPALIPVLIRSCACCHRDCRLRNLCLSQVCKLRTQLTVPLILRRGRSQSPSALDMPFHAEMDSVPSGTNFSARFTSSPYR